MGKVNKICRVSKYGFFSFIGRINSGLSFIIESDFLSNFLSDGVLKDEKKIEKWFYKNTYLLKTYKVHFTLYFGGTMEQRETM